MISPLFSRKYGVERMSEFIDKLKEIYEDEKDLENPPSYLKTIEEILEIDSSLNGQKDVQTTN
jgi:hypothetical protein